MTRAKRGLRVQWIAYSNKTQHGKIVSLHRKSGMMMLCTDDDLLWQARKVHDAWCAYSGGETFTFTLYVCPTPVANI